MQSVSTLNCNKLNNLNYENIKFLKVKWNDMELLINNIIQILWKGEKGMKQLWLD